MEELLDMITTDESPSQISDKIKDLLFAKTSERVDTFRPMVANSVFTGQDTVEVEDEDTSEEE